MSALPLPTAEISKTNYIFNKRTLVYDETQDKSFAYSGDKITLSKDLLTTPINTELTPDGFSRGTANVSFVQLYENKQKTQAIVYDIANPSTLLEVNDTILVDAGIANQTTTINDGNITIQGTGLNNNPLLSLNTGTGNGFLFQECYNQRTAQTGEFARQSFYAKNSAGTKTEYARIHQNAPAITAGAVRGRIDFAVGVGSGLQDYLSLNGNTSQVEITNSTLQLNNNNISNANTISTPLINYYGKQINPVFLNAHTNMSGNIEQNVRYNAFNAGRTPTWEQASINDFIGSVENITASQYGFNSYWWVGTSIGNVYYSTDSGATWNFVYGFGSKINCFQTYNGNSYMMIGGQFTGTYNYIASIDTSLAITDPTGFSGLNSEVNCFYEDTAHSVLLIGGAFTAFYGMSGTFYGFVAFVWGASSWYALNNYSSAGFTGGAVKSITYNTGNNFVIVGGDFTDENITGSNLGIPYIFTFQTPDGYTVSSYFGIGVSLGAPVSSVLTYSGSDIIVGGQFTNTAGVGSCTTNYGFKMTWNGVNWDLYDYPLYGPSNVISSITYIASTGVYYTIENGNIIFRGATQLPSIPTGSSWQCIAYNGSSTYFATNNQTSVGFLFYQLNDSLVITISSIGVSFVTYSGVYTICNLLGFGSAVEMMYNNGTWWVVSQIGCSFS